MINLSGKISAFYGLTDNSGLNLYDDYKKTENTFHLLVAQIKQTLNIQLPAYAMVDKFFLQNHLKNSGLHLINAISENNELTPLKRSIEKLPSYQAAVNLDLLPVFFSTNMQNILPNSLYFPVDDSFYLLFSYQQLPENISPLCNIGLKAYINILNLHIYKAQYKILALNQELKNTLQEYNIKVANSSKSPYFRLVIECDNKKLAEKLYYILYVNEILTDINGNSIILTLKPSVSQTDLKPKLKKSVEKLKSTI